MFKSATSDHEDPFHSSVAPVKLGLSPPKTKPEVVVPAPPDCLLDVISATSVQLVPFHCSTAPVSSALGGSPPANKAAVCVPSPAQEILLNLYH